MGRVAAALLFVLVAAAPALAQEGESGGPVNGPAYVAFPPIVLPVIGRDRVTEQVGVAVSLELVKGQTAASVEPKRAVLTDAFIGDLYAIFQQRARMQQVADSTLIKVRLLRTANRILGPGVVQDVLIEKLFEQPG